MTGGERSRPNAVRLLYRHVVEERARRMFRPGARLLTLPRVSHDAGPFDGACAGPGALDGADLEAAGRSLAAELRPGAPVLLCIARRRPAGGRLGLREAQTQLGPHFAWSDSFGLGVFLPGEAREGWARRHPQAFGILAALERVVRRWPVVRGLGEYSVLEGARRADRARDRL